MTLDELNNRKVALENSIAQTTNQLLMLHGHKQEIEYQIQLEQERIAQEELDKVANSELQEIQ